RDNSRCATGSSVRLSTVGLLSTAWSSAWSSGLTTHGRERHDDEDGVARAAQLATCHFPPSRDKTGLSSSQGKDRSRVFLRALRCPAIFNSEATLSPSAAVRFRTGALCHGLGTCPQIAAGRIRKETKGARCAAVRGYRKLRRGHLRSVAFRVAGRLWRQKIFYRSVRGGWQFSRHIRRQKIRMRGQDSGRGTGEILAGYDSKVILSRGLSGST